MKSFPFNRTSHYVTIIIVFLYRRVLITKYEPQCMFPRRNWDPPPSPTSVCAPSLREVKGGGTLTCGERVGESQFQRLEKKLSSLSTLCFHYSLVETFFCFYSWGTSTGCRALRTPCWTRFTKEVASGICRIFEKLWLWTKVRYRDDKQFST